MMSWDFGISVAITDCLLFSRGLSGGGSRLQISNCKGCPSLEGEAEGTTVNANTGHKEPEAQQATTLTSIDSTSFWFSREARVASPWPAKAPHTKPGLIVESRRPSDVSYRADGARYWKFRLKEICAVDAGGFVGPLECGTSPCSGSSCA